MSIVGSSSFGSRFKFSKDFSDEPLSDDYNSIRSDFLRYINVSKLTDDNVDSESIRFRHLKKSPTVLKFKDLSDSIWSSTAAVMSSIGKAGSYDLLRNSALIADNTLQINHRSPETSQSGNLIQFSFWYYPYSLSNASSVAPGIKVDGSWIALTGYKRRCGVGVGFYAEHDQNPYRNNPSFRIHPYLQQTSYLNTGVGSYDRLGSVAYGGPVISTVTIPKSGISGYRLSEISAFGVMVKVDSREDSIGTRKRVSECTIYDRLFMSLVSRDDH